MSTTTNNELINELEIHEITDAIVNAAKGNKPVKKSKKTVSLTDEIKSCFNDDKSMNESIASIEELIKAKVDAAIASTQAQAVAADTKPKKKRATKDANTKVVEAEEPSVDTATVDTATVDTATVDTTTVDTTTVADLPAKKKRATKAKKVIEEPQQVEVIDSVDEISDILAKTSLNDATGATTEVAEEAKTEKPKKKRASKKVVDDEAKPKKKTAVKVKKTTDTEVSDSDSDEPNEDKPKKKPVSKSKKVELPVEEVIEPVKNGFLEPVVNMEDNEADDSSVKTSDFIQPLTITDELEEDELSDIEE